MRRFSLVITATLLLCTLSGSGIAQHGGHPQAAHHAQRMHGAGEQAPQGTASAAGTASIPEPREFVTTHSVRADGKTLRYRAIASETYLRDDHGNPKASIFSTAYFRDGLVSDSESRPLTFIFNGGPGSSSVWLHLGAFGPRRLDLGADPLQGGAPPYRLEDNAHTLLTVSDLVFVDPVGTGYSRSLGDQQSSAYWGVDEDARCLAEFVRMFLTKHGRWQSPKYLAGESYGTIRASYLIRELSLSTLNGMPFNGVIFVSSAVDARLFLGGHPGNEIAYVTDLPTYAATAYYHDKLPSRPANLEPFLEEVRSFASNEYLTALFQGADLDATTRRAIASRLHQYTGLSEEYLLQSNLRVPSRRFLKELLRDRGETLGRLDTRFRGKDPDDVGEMVRWDPFQAGIAGPFVTAINGYLGGELAVDWQRQYEVFSAQANASWKRPLFGQHAFSGYLYAVEPIAQAAAANKDFRIFVASGYHDLTTSFFGAEYTFRQSGIDPERVTLENYEGGHMMYLNESSLARLSRDLRAFIAG